MKINIRYMKKNDLFEFQAIEKKLRAHFLLTRAELNGLRSILEKALLESKVKQKDDKNTRGENNVQG